MELIINPEFRDKIPPLTDAEFDQLRENILSDGEVYEPIVVWNGTIVDGHNRWKIIQERPDIPYRIKKMDFADKWAAFEWMYRKQLGRRNLTDEQKAYMIGKMYEARKKSSGGQIGNSNAKNEVDNLSISFSGGDHGNQYTKMANGQNVHLPTRRVSRDGTAGQIGKEVGVDSRTVRRAADFAKGVDALKEVSPEAAEKVLQGGTGATKQMISELPKMEPEKRNEVADAILSDGKIGATKGARKSRGRNAGYSKDMREINEVIQRAATASRDQSDAPEYTVEDLCEEIAVNAKAYVDMLRNTLAIRSTVLDKDRERVRKSVQDAINDIMKVRDMI